jgi:regulator of replication initiation timing
MDSNRQLLDQMGQMQQQVQQMMQQQQQMQQQLTSTPSEQSEPQSEPQRVMINQQDEDMEDDEMEQVRAELESGRMKQVRFSRYLGEHIIDARKSNDSTR